MICGSLGLIWRCKVYGLVTDGASSANFVLLNTADDWLHLLLAIGMIGVGLLLGRSPSQINLRHTDIRSDAG